MEISIDTPTIIFLHDSLGSVELWRDFPDQLCKATGCNMLVYDRQGYGHSDPMAEPERTNNYMEQEADTLQLLIQTLNIQQPVLFGHSDGASIALIFAGKYPEAVSAVIAEAGHLFVEDIT
ncbi:MAG TPA: alpha/beta hydrolase, partial [Pseudobacter sp.]|nr:alpha/beta hydrolase [Pseudobacter sp.]